MSTYEHVSRRDLKARPTSVTAVAACEVGSEAVRESTTMLKRKRTPTKVVTKFELVSDLEHDDTSPLSVECCCVDPNAKDGGVASIGEYRGGSGLMTKCHTKESQTLQIHRHRPI